MSETTPQPQTQTQTQAQRRVRYGLNVAVAMFAATLVVVLINTIAERKLRQGGPWKSWIRYDLTATRSYSLSDQTHRVLESLSEPHRIVTLLSGSGEFVQRARDLVDEYGHQSDQLTVEHIDPALEIARLEGFLAGLRDRYQDRLLSLEQALAHGKEILDDARQAVNQIQPILVGALENPGLSDAQLRQTLQRVRGGITRCDAHLEKLGPEIEAVLAQPLPDYSGMLAMVQETLKQCHKIYNEAILELDQVASLPAVAGPVQEKILEAIDHLRRAAPPLAGVVSHLDQAQAVEDYDKMLTQLARPQTLVIAGPQRVQVLTLGELFRRPDTSAPPQGPAPQPLFQGEEKITGTLLSLNLEHRPMVVFLGDGQVQALGPRGLMNHVGQRLENLDFQVEQWSPTGQPGPMGQTLPPGPPPQPKPGQKAVWIALPGLPPNPMNPLAGAGYAQVVETLEERLNAGDGALVLLSVSRFGSFGDATHSVIDLLQPWGISPQLDRLILRQITLPDHRKIPMRLLPMTSWPKDTPITATMGRMPGVFVWASPLVLGDEQTKGVKLWALAQVSGEEVWTEREFDSNPPPQLDPANAGGPFVIAAASQKDDHRLVVVADPSWVSDEVTTNADEFLQMPGLAGLLGAAYPANSELFINSVIWLAGLDELIASSARTQDIRRIDHDLNPTGIKWGLMLGMPLCAALSGLMVWSLRQRG